MNPRQQAQLLELQRRLHLRHSLLDWARLALGQEPALHHRFLIKQLEAVAHGTIKRLIVMMPPGAAKSRYSSIAFPPWFLAQRKDLAILACSYSYSLVEGFGRTCRNLVGQYKTTLGYELASDSKAAGEWETSNGGRYFCAGTGAGIAGYRADLGLIDDPIGSFEEANSKLYRDKLWAWYWEDFVPRLKPGASRVIICNRRHEDDLVGRLLDPKLSGEEAKQWTVISLPLLAEENDPLGRQPGERLWPEWFTEEMVAEARQNPRTLASLYQQHPTPESGDFFKSDWLLGYTLDELPKNLQIYAASDHAVSTARGANKSCFLPFGIDDHDVVWILPDIFWKVAPPGECVEAMLDMVERRHPTRWRAEKGHISKSLLPLIRKRMKERKLYFVIDERTPVHSKRARAGSIAGRMQMGMVRFPHFAPWWPDAMQEMLSFTGSGDDKSDDFCDALAHIGLMLDELHKPMQPQQLPEGLPETTPFTGKWLHEQARRQTQLTTHDDR